MPEPIVVCDYDPAWPARYAALSAAIGAALGPLADDIQHVGSTSVPGLAAKPTIDLVVRLKSADDLAAAIARLATLGYAHEGDLGIVGREAFATPPGYGVHDHHLYVCHPDCAGYDDQIAFRDHLRAHAEDAAAYGALKRALAVAHRTDRTGYTNAKTDFVHGILAKVGRR